MHWLTKYTNKECYTFHNMATLFNNHPYISSSGTPVGTRFTAITLSLTMFVGLKLEVPSLGDSLLGLPFLSIKCYQILGIRAL